MELEPGHSLGNRAETNLSRHLQPWDDGSASWLIQPQQKASLKVQGLTGKTKVSSRKLRRVTGTARAARPMRAPSAHPSAPSSALALTLASTGQGFTDELGK